MQRSSLIAGAILGAAIFCLWPRQHNTALNADSGSPFRSTPIVEISVKTNGPSAMDSLATGNAGWPFSTPGVNERIVTFLQPLDLRAFSALNLPVDLPARDVGRVRVTLSLTHRDGWVYQAWHELPLNFGERSVFSIDLRPGSADLIPRGHCRPWDGESARAIQKLTLSVHSEGVSHGYLEVGPPKLDALPVAATDTGGAKSDSWPPASLKLTDFAAQVSHGNVEIQVRPDPMPADPFDPERCDLRVLLLKASDARKLNLARGAALPSEMLARARMAYFDQNYFRVEGLQNPAEELKPTGAPRFLARIQLDPGFSLDSVTALILLNGKVLSQANLNGIPAAPPDSASTETKFNPVKEPPSWSVSGAQSFCEVYSPRIQWTGMPWRMEAARYLGVDAKTPEASWSFGEWKDSRACWLAPIEWNQAWGKWQGLGRYDLELCWRFDRILERAASEGVRLPLLLTSDEMFFNHGTFRWPVNPLSAEAGGPLSSIGEFFTDARARADFRRRARYLSARYGASPALERWLFGATLPAEKVPAWHAEMAAFIRGMDNARGWYAPGAPGLAAAPVREIETLHPWATEFSKLSRKNSFEAGSKDFENWFADVRLTPGSVMHLSNSIASDGLQSAALRAKVMPGNFCMVRELHFSNAEADNFYDFRSLAFDVYVPPGAPHDMRVVVHLRDRDELWYETLLDPLLRPGEWTKMVVDITGDNIHKLKPTNHQRPWDDYSRTRIREIGFRIFCAHEFKGEVNIDNIYLAGTQVGVVQPKVVPVVEVRGSPARNVGRYEKWEVDFDLNKSYPNPYDPEVVEVRGIVTCPDGREIPVPAFFYEPYDRKIVMQPIPNGDDGDLEHDAEVERIVPVAGGMKGYWKLRYAPETEGAYSVVLEVREGGKWAKTKERWIADDRFTHNGEPLPNAQNWGGNRFTYIPDRHEDGRRLLQDLRYTPGEVVARGAPIRLVAEPSNSHGFVRPSKDPHYLEHSDGTFFYPIGMCLSTPIEDQLPFRGGVWASSRGYRKVHDTGRRGTYQYDDYFSEFEKHRLNWAKVWMSTWWTAMEWRRDWPPYQGAGRYSQPNAWRMDYLVEAARAKGIFLQLILMNHGQVSSGINHDWENNPYNEELGGQVRSAREFYSDYDAKRLFKNKLRYIVARWGYSTSILDWTLCGEMDFTEDYQTNSFNIQLPSNDKPAPESMLAWLDEMGAYMKEIDQGRHLVGTHVSHPQRGQEIQRASILDYVQSNAYSGFYWLANGSMNAVDAITAFYYGQGGRNHFGGMSAFNKPILICEQGGDWHGISRKYGNFTRNTRDSLDADLHCGLWAGVLTPLAGQTGYWWWLHIHFDGGYEQFEAVARFMQGEDLRGQNFERNTVRAESSGGDLQALSFQNSKRGFAWIYAKSMPFVLNHETFKQVKASIDHVEAGTYEIEYWDTMKGKVILNQTAQTNADDGETVLQLSVPPFEGDVAIKFKKVK